MSGQFVVPAALFSGKEPALPVGLGAGVPQSQSGRRVVEKIILSLPEIEPRPFSP
jgi:hypothetical protein